MNRCRPYNAGMNGLPRLFTVIIAMSVSSFAHGAGRSHPEAPASCGSVQSLNTEPVTALSPEIQSKIRLAVRPALKMIIHDPGIGLSDLKPETVPLNAIAIAQPTKSSSLYIVSWDDRSFGTNGFNWIVEVTPQETRSLLQPSLSKRGVFYSGGFGVDVLQSGLGAYPEIMFASSGFKPQGGAEAESRCFEKKGSFYEPIACPADCHRNLNSR